MGVSAQQHRVATGLFHGRMCSSSWSSFTGVYREKGRGRGPDIDSTGSGTWWTTLLLIVVTCMTVSHTLELVTASTTGGQQSDAFILSQAELGGVEFSQTRASELLRVIMYNHQVHIL